MSYVNSRRFTILSSNIKTSLDVFDRLIDVKDSVTGEEGKLLCSHMCAFPSNLVNQATWLAGCKPKSNWENDDRLALGYHPNHYIQWRIFKETNEIELYLTGGWSNPEETTSNYAGGGDDDLEFLFTGLPFLSRPSRLAVTVPLPVRASVPFVTALRSRGMCQPIVLC